MRTLLVLLAPLAYPGYSRTTVAPAPRNSFQPFADSSSAFRSIQPFTIFAKFTGL
jgi:hypothetical protein